MIFWRNVHFIVIYHICVVKELGVPPTLYSQRLTITESAAVFWMCGGTWVIWKLQTQHGDVIGFEVHLYFQSLCIMVFLRNTNFTWNTSFVFKWLLKLLSPSHPCFERLTMGESIAVFGMCRDRQDHKIPVQLESNEHCGHSNLLRIFVLYITS